MQTLIDAYELVSTLPPPRAPMMTLSVDVEFEFDLEQQIALLRESEVRSVSGSQPDVSPDSWTHVRCWCSED